MHRLLPFAFLAALATWPVYAQDQTRGRLEGVKDPLSDHIAFEQDKLAASREDASDLESA
jgi:hypothetical protein